MADKSCELVGESDDLVHVIDEIIKHGDYVLSQTPRNASGFETGRSS